MTNIQPANDVDAVVVGDDDRSYIDWPAIFAGTVLATAISFLLLTFGSAIGLSMSSAEAGEGMSLFWMAIVAALWLLWVQISSFLAGGYVAGRMRRRHGDATEYESDVRDGVNGLVVWGLGLLVSAFIAFWGIGGTVSTATSAIGAAGSVVTQTADRFGVDTLLVDRALRGGPNAQPIDEGTREEVARMLATTLGDGEFDAGDRSYLVSVVATRAGIEPAEAEQRIDQIVEQARDTAETARRVAMITAFMVAASLAVSAAAAYYGATLGGNHRDKQMVVEGWYKPW
ncbi:hypothetical protein [Aquamicrobium sp. LC103]|uniref:hypothetical protein n=1 Tax=Aquamicrobium sp. LC103 TaxID=1120658 RepID=UPI00069C6CC9|nr:hypothetical protein [Aquamicrobium sp. LC103]TKT77620.1 hypothetical protein XW59_014245 [Aquamicrobium sp. LC103]